MTKQKAGEKVLDLRRFTSDWVKKRMDASIRGPQMNQLKPFLAPLGFSDKELAFRGFQAKCIVTDFHSYDVTLSGCLVLNPVSYLHQSTLFLS